MKILNQGFDHVEFVVNQISTHQATWERMGFEKVAEVELPKKGAKQVVMAQGFVRFLITQYNGSPEANAQPGYTFLKAHGDGICVLAVEVEDATAAFKEVVAKGARPAMEPTRFETPEGTLVLSEVYTPADFRYRFVQRTLSGQTKPGVGDFKKPALFLDGVVVSRLESPSPTGIHKIDHLTQ